MVSNDILIFFFCRDGLHESNVVTKTFMVEDVGPPGEHDLESLDLGSTDWRETRPSTAKGKFTKKKVSSEYVLPGHIAGDCS